MKATVNAYLYMDNMLPDEYIAGEPFEKKFRPVIKRFKSTTDSLDSLDSLDSIFIREMRIDVDVPDDFDPVPAQVKALETLKLDVLEEFQKKTAEVNEQLSKLLCLTNEVSAS